jgi:hypothetical protein
VYVLDEHRHAIGKDSHRLVLEVGVLPVAAFERASSSALPSNSVTMRSNGRVWRKPLQTLGFLTLRSHHGLGVGEIGQRLVAFGRKQEPFKIATKAPASSPSSKFSGGRGIAGGSPRREEARPGSREPNSRWGKKERRPTGAAMPLMASGTAEGEGVVGAIRNAHALLEGVLGSAPTAGAKSAA